VGWHLLRDGRVQGIEGERIRTPVGSHANIDVQQLVHGVRLDKGGAAEAYCVKRDQSSEAGNSSGWCQNGTCCFTPISGATT